MIVHKYRDVIRMTLFGRHDKNINDTTSIYQGYDRYATTTTGGGVNSITVNQNTYLWDCPVARPTDSGRYTWNESTRTWDAIPETSGA